MRYKVGDKVVIRGDLEADIDYDGTNFADEMKEWCGKQVEIISDCGTAYFLVNGEGWAWTDEMIDHEATAKLQAKSQGDIEWVKPGIMAEETDNVNHPPHYTQGKYEIIDIIEVISSFYKGFEAYLIGSIIKYIARAPFKGNKIEDLKKARWYLNKLIGDE